jgi:hypothetical protein
MGRHPDLGEGGVAVLAVLMLAAAWRMRRFPQLSAILLPFFAAALVNSAAPDNALVALGIILFAFGRAPSAATSVEDTTGPGSAVAP